MFILKLFCGAVDGFSTEHRSAVFAGWLARYSTTRPPPSQGRGGAGGGVRASSIDACLSHIWLLTTHAYSYFETRSTVHMLQTMDRDISNIRTLKNVSSVYIYAERAAIEVSHQACEYDFMRTCTFSISTAASAYYFDFLNKLHIPGTFVLRTSILSPLPLPVSSSATAISLREGGGGERGRVQ